MALLFESWWSELFFTIFVFFLVNYLYFKLFTARYWKRCNIFHVEPVFLLGNAWNANFTENFGFILSNFYKKYKHHKLVGFWNFTQPNLLVTDLDLIKNILTKDFNYFRNRRTDFDLKYDPLTRHLLNLSGNHWKSLRVKLTPTFTSGKMKMMFPTLVKCGEELQLFLQENPEVRECMEAKDILSRFTSDIIASCAFGIETNSLHNPDSQFRVLGRKIFQGSLIGILKRIFLTVAPFFFNLFKLYLTPKDVSDFFLKAVRETMEYRETNNIKRNDFLDLLIQLKNKGKIDDVDSSIVNKEEQDASSNGMKFSYNDAAAQAFVFFIAGFETSSTTLTFTLYELALNSDIQVKLQQEIDENLKKTNGKMTYDGIMEMKYLDKVIQETMRKHSPALTLMRECEKDYKIPEMNATIPKGASVLISVFGIHRDPEIYPDPEKFDPERFSPEQKALRHNSAVLSFGEGPRNCIGMRFGLMQTKIGLVSIMSQFTVQTTSKTPIPIVYHKRNFVLSPESDMFLKLVKRV